MCHVNGGLGMGDFYIKLSKPRILSLIINSFNQFNKH